MMKVLVILIALGMLVSAGWYLYQNGYLDRLISKFKSATGKKK